MKARYAKTTKDPKTQRPWHSELGFN